MAKCGSEEDWCETLDIINFDLQVGIWRYHAPNGSVIAETIQFISDGTLIGFDHPNITRWRQDADALFLLKEDGSEVVRLDRSIPDAPYETIQGHFVRDPSAVVRLERRDWSTREPRKEATAIQYADDAKKHGWQIGDHTYGRPAVYERTAKLTIGKYTCFASGVQIALGNHRTNTVSSYPFQTLRKYWPSMPRDVPDHETKGDVIIGSDVWFGAYSFVASGVTVGHGAVIGAHSVVTKDVPPYAIVVGSPTKIVRYRFSPELISELLDIAWWDWPDDKVDAFLPLIMSDDTWAFVRAAKSGQPK